MQSLRSGLAWLLSLFLIVLFAFAAIAKFVAPPGDNIVFATLALNTGVAAIEPTGRYAVGVAEGLVAVLLLFEGTRRWGALLGFLVLLGAAGAHLSPYLGVAIAEDFGSQATDGGSLFQLALIGLVISVFVMALAPKDAKRRA